MIVAVTLLAMASSFLWFSWAWGTDRARTPRTSTWWSGSTVKGLAEIEKGYVDFLFALAGE